MESLIQIINKLQDVFAVVGSDHQVADLPQIVVVGTQSSGKSSVLESLVGKSFLPRGTGIVTRAPLVVQLIKYSEEDRKSMLNYRNPVVLPTDCVISHQKKKKKKKNVTWQCDVTEWAEFLHRPREFYFDFDAVRKEIQYRTDIIAGKNKGITNTQIVLKIYTKLYDLTFVDLPGITKVPVGDQPEDIDQQIQNLIINYAKQANSIILAVVTANTDPSTSESLQIAKKLDPEGIRTIAVVTKLDLIDEGTLDDTKDLLCGNKIPVQLGIIGVVNRSQKEINENKTMEDTLEAETNFLQKYYPDICKNHGNKALAYNLQSVLIKHIKKVYPILREQLEDMKKKLGSTLLTLQTPDNKISFVIRLLKDLSKSYEDIINGSQNNISGDEIIGGANISQIIEHKYLKTIDDIDPLKDLTDRNIANILLNTSGIKKSSFVNEKGLQKILRKQIHNLIEPSMDCVDLVANEMLNLFDSIDLHILTTLKRFPVLDKDIRIVFENMIKENVNEIKEFIRSYIESYQECIDTTNKDFIFEIVKSPNPIEKFPVELITSIVCQRKNSVSSNEDSENDKNVIKKIQMFQKLLSGSNDGESIESSDQVKLHKELCHCYFIFIRKIIRDYVPKRIYHKMVIVFLNNLDLHLNEKIFQSYLIEKKMDEVFCENKHFQVDREETEKKLDAVVKALKNMMDIHYF